MVKYQIYQGRPCGTTARGDARWLRSALEKEALRRGISAIGTLDQICTRLIAYDSSVPKKQETQRREKQETQRREKQTVQRREKQENQRREKQENQRREKQETQRREKQTVQRREIPKTPLDQSIAWLTSYLGIINTLYWSLKPPFRKDEYLYRCTAKCSVPEDPVIVDQVFGYYKRDINNIRIETSHNTLKEDPSLKPEDCQLTHRFEFLPKKCIRQWEKDAIFENPLDHQDYQRIEDIQCPSDCESGFSHVYHKLQTNEYFILFQIGVFMRQRESSKLIGAMIFINKVLLKYLGKGYRVVIGGHSSGGVNAIYIARVISMLDEQFQMMIDALSNCPEKNQPSDDSWYNNPKALCWETKSAWLHGFQNASSEIFVNSRSSDINLKYFTSQISQCQKIVQQYRSELRELIFITSGGHSSIEGGIPWDQTEKFFTHRIINFAVMLYTGNNQRERDTFFSTSRSHKGLLEKYGDDYILSRLGKSAYKYDSIPVIGLFNESDHNELRLIDDPFKFSMTQKDVVWTLVAHNFSVYRTILVDLLKDPEQMSRFASYLFKGE